MQKAVLHKLLPIALASTVIASGNAYASPTYDPTFVANVRPTQVKTIVQASDGGYFLSGGGFPPFWTDSFPCSPAKTSRLNVPGYEAPFPTHIPHFLYPTVKLTQSGVMDCDFQLWNGYPSPSVILPDGNGRIYAASGVNPLMLYDALIGGQLKLGFPYHIARFFEGSGKLDNTVILGHVGGDGVFLGDFIPMSSLGITHNIARTVAFDKSASTTKLVLGGLHQFTYAGDYANIWRLNADGSWDNSFHPLRLDWSDRKSVV